MLITKMKVFDHVPMTKVSYYLVSGNHRSFEPSDSPFDKSAYHIPTDSVLSYGKEKGYFNKGITKHPALDYCRRLTVSFVNSKNEILPIDNILLERWGNFVFNDNLFFTWIQFTPSLTNVRLFSRIETSNATPVIIRHPEEFLPINWIPWKDRNKCINQPPTKAL